MTDRRFALGLDSFSLHLHYDLDKFNVFDLLDLVDRWGLDGVQINLNGPHNRHLSGDTPAHYRHLGRRLSMRHYFVELASAGTDPDRLAPVLELCRYLGGDLVRTVIAAGGEIDKEWSAAPNNLRRLADIAARLGVRVAVENHEDVSAPQLVELVQWVGSEWIGVLFDTGNSLVLWEDPQQAAWTLAPFTVGVHLKDQVIVQAEDGLRSAGTRLGRGIIDLAAIVDILRRRSPCDRMLVQLCYGYSQLLGPPAAPAKALPAADFWKPRPGPYDPAEVLLPEHFHPEIDKESLLRDEMAHLEASIRYARRLLFGTTKDTG